MEMQMESPDRVSTGLAQFLDRLSPEEREGLSGVLQDPRTFLAEDMTDVLAILRQLRS
jgi:hypothetical protein